MCFISFVINFLKHFAYEMGIEAVSANSEILNRQTGRTPSLEVSGDMILLFGCIEHWLSVIIGHRGY